MRSLSATGQDVVLVVGSGGKSTCTRCRPFDNRLLSLGAVPQESAAITDAGGNVRTQQIMATLPEAMAYGLMHVASSHDLIRWADGLDVSGLDAPREAVYVPSYEDYQRRSSAP